MQQGGWVTVRIALPEDTNRATKRDEVKSPLDIDKGCKSEKSSVAHHDTHGSYPGFLAISMEIGNPEKGLRDPLKNRSSALQKFLLAGLKESDIQRSHRSPSLSLTILFLHKSRSGSW